MNAAVFGAGGGLGEALARALIIRGAYDRVFAASRHVVEIEGAVALEVDPLSEDSLKVAAGKIGDQGPLDLCVVSIGVLSDEDALQPERSYRHQSLANFERVFRTNTFAPALIAKYFLPLMSRNKPAIFAVLSARVGSITDNRLGGWHAYRASKAALNMLIKNFAIEQESRNKQFIACGLHPGTVDTPLSKPFQKNVPKDQLFSPAQSAAYLLDVIGDLTPSDSGKVFDWAGKEVPA